MQSDSDLRCMFDRLLNYRKLKFLCRTLGVGFFSFFLFSFTYLVGSAVAQW